MLSLGFPPGRFGGPRMGRSAACRALGARTGPAAYSAEALDLEAGRRRELVRDESCMGLPPVHGVSRSAPLLPGQHKGETEELMR